MNTHMAISVDAQCGATVMLACPSGQSCSQWGWCGYTAEYSGAGCQPEYGVCDSVPSGSVVGASGSQAGVVPAPSAYPPASTLVTVTLSTPQPYSPPSPPPVQPSPPASSAAPAPPQSQPTSPPSYSPSSPVPYTLFLGSGETSASWPSESEWLTYEELFSANMKILQSSCAQWSVDDNSEQEISDLKAAISNTASAHQIDERFILAIVMQESNGCVRAPTTSYSVTNPGLMQSFNGQGSCNRGSAQAPSGVQTPCPESEIDQMIQDGTAGTGPGAMSLTLALQTAACSDVSRYYKAARIYNSGSIAPSGLLQDGVATHCYSSDIANRLLGWNGDVPTGCNLN